MKAKYTSTPISSQAIPCDQVTVSVASLSNVTSGKPQVPAVVNSVNAVSMVTPSTTPTSTGTVFKTSTMNAAAQPFVPVDRLTKVEESTIPHGAKQSHKQQESAHLSRRD